MYQELVNYLVNLNYDSYQIISDVYTVLLFIVGSGMIVWGTIKFFNVEHLFLSIGLTGVFTCLFFALVYAPFRQAETIFKQYSESQLQEIYLSTDLSLFKVNKDDDVSLGNVSMKKDNKSVLLGKIDCRDLSFKKCVDEIVQNKDKIISSLKDSETYVVNNM